MDITTFLLPMALKGFALAGVVVVACSALRRARGGVLHAVLAALFAALVALPVLQVAGPVWKVPVATTQLATVTARSLTEGSVPHEALTRGALPDVDARTARRAAPRAPDTQAVHVQALHAGPEAVASATASISPPASPSESFGYSVTTREWASLGASWGWLALCAWGVGALLVVLYWTTALASAARLVRAARPVTDDQWLSALAQTQRSLGQAGTVRLLQSNRVSTPFAWGLGSPAVVLPASSGAWDADARVAVLQHEVAHLVRRDPHVQLVAQAALALHWFNPLAWAAYRQLLLARERACDDAALAAGVAPSSYAGLLLSVARRARASAAPCTRERVALSAVSSMARPSELERRIVCVLDPDARRGGSSKRVRAVLGLGVLAALVPLAAFRPVAGEESTATGETDTRRVEENASEEVAVSAVIAEAPEPASAHTSAVAADPARAAPPIPGTTRPPSSPIQQSLPVSPASPVPSLPPSSEPRPASAQNASQGLGDASAPRRQEDAQMRPTPEVPEAAGLGGGVNWDAVTEARLAAEAALRQRHD